MAEIVETTGHDGRPRYQKRVYVGGRQRMITARSKRDLAAMERQMREDYARGTLADGKKRLAPFMEAWLDRILATKTPAAYLSFKWHYDHHIKEQLGGLQLSELKAWVLQQWIDNLLGADDLPASPHKQHRCRIVLHACLQTAVKQGLLVQNPCDFLDLPPLRAKQAKAWTLAEARRFLLDAVDHPYSIYFQLALWMPVRPSEVLGLRWSSIDMERGVLEITEVRAHYGNIGYTGEPKTPRSARTFELHPDALEALKRWKATQNERRLRLGRNWKAEDYVCSGPEGGPVHYRVLQRTFARLLRNANLPAITLYQLRHTVISILADAGESMKIISELAGHANVGITMNVYQQTRQGQHKAALAALSGLYHSDDDVPESGASRALSTSS